MRPLAYLFSAALLVSSSAALAQGDLLPGGADIDLGVDVGGEIDVGGDLDVGGELDVDGQIEVPGGPAIELDVQGQVGVTGGAFLQNLQPDQLHTGELRRTNIQDSAGADIGSISNVLVDVDGRVVAALVDVGGFLGIGARTVAVSWDALQVVREPVDGEAAGDVVIRTDITRAQLEEAPTFDATPVLDATGQVDAGAFVLGRNLNQLHTAELQRTNVEDAAGDSIGTFSDLIIGADGQVDAALVYVGGFLGIGGRTVAISWDSLQISRELVEGEATGDFVIRTNLTPEQVEDAPTFDEDPEVSTPGPIVDPAIE